MTTGMKRENWRTVAFISFAVVILALLLAPLVPVSATAARALGAAQGPSAVADRSADFTWSPAADADENGDLFVEDSDDLEKALVGGANHTGDHLRGQAIDSTPALSPVWVPYLSAVHRE
jgi:hypothetical protein